MRLMCFPSSWKCLVGCALLWGAFHTCVFFCFFFKLCLDSFYLGKAINKTKCFTQIYREVLQQVYIVLFEYVYVSLKFQNQKEIYKIYKVVSSCRSWNTVDFAVYKLK